MRRPMRASRRLAVALGAAAICFSATGCLYVAAGTATGAAVGAAFGLAVSPDSGWKTVNGIPVGAAISVKLTPTRDVVGITPGASDSTRLRNVRTLAGRINAIRGDTIRLAVSEARLENDRTQRFRTPLMTIIPPGPNAAIQVISRRPGMAGGAVAGAWLGAVVGLFSVLSGLK